MVNNRASSASDGRACCGMMSLMTAMWIRAIINLVMVGFVWLMGALYFLGITETKERTQFDQQVGFAGAVGESALLIAATLWLVFIIMLMYGLKKRQGEYILYHLIACLVLVILLLVQFISAIVHGVTVNIIWPAIVLVVLIAGLWTEYKCYKYLGGTKLSLPI